MPDWQTRRKAKQERMRAAASMMEGRVVRTERAADLLQALLRPGDRVALEGDNQKQADFLARSLTQLDPAAVHDLHLLISSVSLPEHLDVFEKGICRRIDFSYAGEQSVRMAGLVADGTVEVGAIHTYVELYARMFVDLIPDVVLLCAAQADRDGNLFTGPSTEDTPVIAEAAAFHDGVGDRVAARGVSAARRTWGMTRTGDATPRLPGLISRPARARAGAGASWSCRYCRPTTRAASPRS